MKKRNNNVNVVDGLVSIGCILLFGYCVFEPFNDIDPLFGFGIFAVFLLTIPSFVCLGISVILSLISVFVEKPKILSILSQIFKILSIVLYFVIFELEFTFDLILLIPLIGIGFLLFFIIYYKKIKKNNIAKPNNN